MKIVSIVTNSKVDNGVEHGDKSFVVCLQATCSKAHPPEEHLIYTFGLHNNPMTEAEMVAQVKCMAKRDTATTEVSVPVKKKVNINI